MKPKQIATIAIVIILCVLAAITIYSRGFAERAKPLVQISFPLTGALLWEYEMRSNMLPIQAGGFNWVVDVILPHAAFRDYLEFEQLNRLEVNLTLDGAGFAKSATLLEVETLEGGSARLLIGYVPHAHVQYREGVLVALTYRSPHQLDNLVPQMAVHQDQNGGHYVFVVRREEGFWGRRHIAERIDVQFLSPPTIGGLANITPNLQGEPVVFVSEAPLYDGADVRIFD